jgi:hypothetical protein
MIDKSITTVGVGQYVDTDQNKEIWRWQVQFWIHNPFYLNLFQHVKAFTLLYSDYDDVCYNSQLGMPIILYDSCESELNE